MSVAGSILMLLLSLFLSPSSDATVAQQPTEIDRPANSPTLNSATDDSTDDDSADDDSSDDDSSDDASSSDDDSSNSDDDVGELPEASSKKAAPTPQPKKKELTTKPSTMLSAADIAARMKGKAKRLDFSDFATIELPGKATDFALDPSSGRLAIVGPWNDQIGFLSADDLTNGSTGTKPQAVPVDGQPTAVAYVARESGGAFAVRTREPDGVTFIDAGSLRPLKTFAIKFGSVLAASKNASMPHVYLSFVGTAERGRARLGVARIDAERMEMDAQWENREFRHISVSPDGQFIYTLPNNSGSDLTRSIPRPPKPDGNAPVWDTDVSRIGRVPTQYYIDPRGATIAAGANVYSADMTQLLMELDYDPLAIMGKKPWMAGLRKYELVVGSKNDGRAVAELELPGEVLVPNEKTRNRPMSVRRGTTLHPAGFAQLFADDQRGRFLLGARHHVVCFPLDKLELDDEPDLSLATMPPQTARVDNTYEVSLKTVSGSPDFVLINGPDGMTVKDGLLSWTPKDGDVGWVDVRVELNEGDVAHDEAWRIEVDRTKLSLPFMAEGCAPSADGTQVVVWGIEWSQGKASETLNSQLALVDLTTNKILATRQLDYRLGRLEFGKDAVYISKKPPRYSKDPSTLVRLAPDDLRDLGEMELEREFLMTVADRYLIGFDGRELFSRYSLPELTLVKAPPVPRRFGSSPITLPRKLADGWLLDGVIWDEELDKARWLIEPYGFVHGWNPIRESTNSSFLGYAFDVPDPADGRFRRANDVLAAVFSPHIPAQLTLRRTTPAQSRIHVDFVDRLSKDVVRSVTLRDGRWRKISLAGRSHIVTTPNHVLATHYGEVFVLPAVGGDVPSPCPSESCPNNRRSSCPQRGRRE